MPDNAAPQRTPILLKAGLGLGGVLALAGLALTVQERFQTGQVQSWWLPAMSVAALVLGGVCIVWLMRIEGRGPSK